MNFCSKLKLPIEQVGKDNLCRMIETYYGCPRCIFFVYICNDEANNGGEK